MHILVPLRQAKIVRRCPKMDIYMCMTPLFMDDVYNLYMLLMFTIIAVVRPHQLPPLAPHLHDLLPHQLRLHTRAGFCVFVYLYFFVFVFAVYF